MGGINFNATVELGTLIEIGVFLFALYGFHIRNVKRFVTLETKVDIMWGQLQRRLGMKDDYES